MKLNTDVTAEELKVFLQETEEQIELMDSDIIRLEREKEDPELLQEIFRAAHTIKGSSAMLGHKPMAELTHAMENLLDNLRNGELSITTEIIDALLHSLDALKVLKKEIASDKDSNLDILPVISRLKEVSKSGTAAPSAQIAAFTLSQPDRENIQAALVKEQSVYHLMVTVDKQSAWAAARCLQVLNELGRIGQVIRSAPSVREIDEEKGGSDLELIFTSDVDADTVQGVVASIAEIGKVMVTRYHAEELASDGEESLSSLAGNTAKGMKNAAEDQKAVTGTARPESQSLQSVRIDVQVLDTLMNIVEELVIDRSRIGRVGRLLASRYGHDGLIHELTQTSDHIIKVINELQENIMKVRMVPIGIIFSRFPRLVRDLAQAQQKKVDFIVVGEETELDRSIIEQIRDPLIHLLRNAIDHGVELPEVRKMAGKTETAVVRLTARQEQEHIVITLEDDGGGIDGSRVKEAAVRKGCISAEIAASLSESEAIDLIFASGVSTAERTTEVSGRGVGMDIVRTNVDNLGGTVTLDTRVGKSTTFTIRLPLTVAIIQGLLVASGDAVYVVPLSAVMETLRVANSEVQTIAQCEVIRLRDAIIPLFRLETVLGMGTEKAEEADSKLVMVVKAGKHPVGLVVDALLERQEIVIKPLGSYLGDIAGIAGVTILGDGQAALILDVPSLTRRMGNNGSTSGEEK